MSECSHTDYGIYEKREAGVNVRTFVCLNPLCKTLLVLTPAPTPPPPVWSDEQLHAAEEIMGTIKSGAWTEIGGYRGPVCAAIERAVPLFSAAAIQRAVEEEREATAVQLQERANYYARDAHRARDTGDKIVADYRMALMEGYSGAAEIIRSRTTRAT